METKIIKAEIKSTELLWTDSKSVNVLFTIENKDGRIKTRMSKKPIWVPYDAILSGGLICAEHIHKLNVEAKKMVDGPKMYEVAEPDYCEREFRVEENDRDWKRIRVYSSGRILLDTLWTDTNGNIFGGKHPTFYDTMDELIADLKNLNLKNLKKLYTA